MKRKIFEIVLVIVGLILGSMANISSHFTAMQISVVTNQDAKVVIKENGQFVNDVTIEGKEMLPVHLNNDNMLCYSPTLSTDNITSLDNGDNYIFKQYDIKLDKDIEKAHLQVDIELNEDSLKGAVKVMVRYKDEIHLLDAENNSVVFDGLLTTQTGQLGVTFYYEMTECTIDEINASTGTDVNVKLYANVVE